MHGRSQEYINTIQKTSCETADRESYSWFWMAYQYDMEDKSAENMNMNHEFLEVASNNISILTEWPVCIRSR